jgi:ring-1,2-phenylacetyl-CoA epoxidase subunit PaaD
MKTMQDTASLIEQQVWERLQEVKDPEMTAASLIEMGMVHKVEVSDGVAYVELIPTFVGCPALIIMEMDVREEVLKIESIKQVNVKFVKSPIWSTDRITVEGQRKLKGIGVSSPPKKIKQSGFWDVTCPYCGSHHTQLKNLFGPTACRSLFYCPTCKNPFEAMKPV